MILCCCVFTPWLEFGKCRFVAGLLRVGVWVLTSCSLFTPWLVFGKCCFVADLLESESIHDSQDAWKSYRRKCLADNLFDQIPLGPVCHFSLVSFCVVHFLFDQLPLGLVRQSRLQVCRWPHSFFFQILTILRVVRATLGCGGTCAFQKPSTCDEVGQSVGLGCCRMF